jgi:hypothetical protein
MSTRRRTLRELAADPQFISGIYNYCDRWCERCPFTSRCLVYATEQEQDAQDPSSRDINNQAFWTRLGEIFEEAQEMLQEMMRERGIELTPGDLDADHERQRQLDDVAESHPCATAANEYARAVGDWLEKATPRFRELGEVLSSQLRLELPGVDPEADARGLKDATDVIQWYQYQIAVKLMRAARSAYDEDLPDGDPAQGDAAGSAKVALIGIDRSLGGWSELLRQMPEEEDAILPLLAGLSRLRRDVEAAFPHARAFVRPGFDTGDGASP